MRTPATPDGLAAGALPGQGASATAKHSAAPVVAQPVGKAAVPVDHRTRKLGKEGDGRRRDKRASSGVGNPSSAGTGGKRSAARGRHDRRRDIDNGGASSLVASRRHSSGVDGEQGETVPRVQGRMKRTPGAAIETVCDRTVKPRLQRWPSSRDADKGDNGGIPMTREAAAALHRSHTGSTVSIRSSVNKKSAAHVISTSSDYVLPKKNACDKKTVPPVSRASTCGGAMSTPNREPSGTVAIAAAARSTANDGDEPTNTRR